MPHSIARRIIEPLLAATRRCVAEGVVADADLADAGVIFGTGFAPYTGGPMNLLASRAEPATDSFARGATAARRKASRALAPPVTSPRVIAPARA